MKTNVELTTADSQNQQHSLFIMNIEKLNPISFKFHSDWNWLMPCLEKLAKSENVNLTELLFLSKNSINNKQFIIEYIIKQITKNKNLKI